MPLPSTTMVPFADSPVFKSGVAAAGEEGAMLEGAMLEGAVVAEGLVVVGVLEEHPDKSTAAPIMSAADPAKVLLWCSFMVALPKLGGSRKPVSSRGGCLGSDLGRAS